MVATLIVPITRVVMSLLAQRAMSRLCGLEHSTKEAAEIPPAGYRGDSTEKDAKIDPVFEAWVYTEELEIE